MARLSSAFSRRSRFNSADSFACRPGPRAGIDLVLADPLTDGFGGSDAEQVGDRADRGPFRLVLVADLGDHEDGSLTKFRRVLFELTNFVLPPKLKPPDPPGRFTARAITCGLGSASSRRLYRRSLSERIHARVLPTLGTATTAATTCTCTPDFASTNSLPDHTSEAILSR